MTVQLVLIHALIHFVILLTLLMSICQTSHCVNAQGTSAHPFNTVAMWISRCLVQNVVIFNFVNQS